MKHYKNLMSALGDAMATCLAWRLAGTEGNYFNARDLFAFALTEEKKEGSLKEGQFYVVSPEGAIGIASGYEYLVSWMFLPLEGKTYDREVARLKSELAHDAQPQAAQQRRTQPQPAQQRKTQPQGAKQPQSTAQTGRMRFCRNCGAQMSATAKFCPKCGTPVSK